MKEKVIETAGKTWQFLGRNGETEISTLSKHLGEKNDVVMQSLGWLAREDKINYAVRDKKAFVSLIETEMQIFNSVIKSLQDSQLMPTRAPRRKGGRIAKLV